MLDVINHRAVIGDNNPPLPTPYELSKIEIENLYLESKNWADGTPIETQEQADAVGRLRGLLKTAADTADTRRVVENKPHDEGKAAVQAKYADLIADTKSKKGKTVLALEMLNQALTPFLLKLEAAKAEEVRVAEEAADATAELARKALEDSRATPDLELREFAETLITEAKQAEMIVGKIEKSKAHVYGGSRAIGLRTTYRPEITDMQVFARHVWTAHFDHLADALTIIAGKLVAQGIHTLPGVTVHEDRSL